MAGYFYNGIHYLKISNRAAKPVLRKEDATLIYSYDTVIKRFCGWPEMEVSFPTGYKYVTAHTAIDVDAYIESTFRYSGLYKASAFIYTRCLNHFIEGKIAKSGTFLYGNVEPLRSVFEESREEHSSFMDSDIIYLSSDTEYLSFLVVAGKLDYVKTLHCLDLDIS